MPVFRPHPPRIASLPAALMLVSFVAAPANASAPASRAYTPATDQVVVERLPTRRLDARTRETEALRSQWRANPQDLTVATRLARRYFDQGLAEGDPRYIGYAQAAMAPWWRQPEPPAPARLVRALLLQYGHHFKEAVQDLQALTSQAATPTALAADAWAWLAAIHMVTADYGPARQACEQLASPGTGRGTDRGADAAARLAPAACLAYVDSMTGQAAQGAARLASALQQAPMAAVALRTWGLTRLAEIEERRGDFAAAERAFGEALRLTAQAGATDTYLLAAYADFLLDRQRPAEVLALLKDRGRADVLLLRLTLAAQAAAAPELAAWQRELAARFEAARSQGDVTHDKEESRFERVVQRRPARALELAQLNFARQREAADARALLEAALAAGQPAAAEPALQWMARSQVESVALRALAQRLKGSP